MKLILILVLLMSSAFGDQSDKNMIEFSVDSVLLGQFAFQKEKEKDRSAEDSQFGLLLVNYARKISGPLPLGFRGEYMRGKATGNHFESVGFQVGGIFNIGDDFSKSLYTSVYVGMEWDHSYLKTLTIHMMKTS